MLLFDKVLIVTSYELQSARSWMMEPPGHTHGGNRTPSIAALEQNNAVLA